MKSNFNFQKINILKNILGVIFILLGILTSRWVLEIFISPYVIVELNSKIPLEVLNLALIGVGIVFILFRFDTLSFKKLLDFYKYFAITFVGAILLFVLVNIILYTGSILKEAVYYRDQIFLGYRQRLSALYPSLKDKEICKLLYETWSRPYVYEPYTQFKEREFKSKYVNVHVDGFRYSKNQGPWPPQPQNLNIFLFGGSTTFNYGVSDDETIASYLQSYFSNKYIGKRIYVYNFGRGHYFSSQERILFEKLLTSGFVPNIAIFIDGLNDFYYYNDEPLFTENLKRFIDDKGTNLLSLPLLSAIKNVKKLSEVDNPQMVTKKYDDITRIEKVINRYIANKKIIDVIASSFKVKAVFIWQPVPTYKYDLKYHIFSGKGFGRFMYSKYGYVYMEKFIKGYNMGNNFLWLADMQQDIKKPLYVDIDHYSALMSEKIAENIYNFLVKKNLVY